MQCDSNRYWPSYGQYEPGYELGYRYPGLDQLEEKQGGPTPADFIPFVASFSLPLTAAFLTFVAIVLVTTIITFLLTQLASILLPASRAQQRSWVNIFCC